VVVRGDFKDTDGSADDGQWISNSISVPPLVVSISSSITALAGMRTDVDPIRIGFPAEICNARYWSRRARAYRLNLRLVFMSPSPFPIITKHDMRTEILRQTDKMTFMLRHNRSNIVFYGMDQLPSPALFLACGA
jgi:hypothetical protein